MGRSGRRGWLVAVVVVAALGLWIGFDLWGPLRADFRVFDPVQVAQLDNAMWRSYYGRQRVRLFLQLAELMRSQFHFPYLRSHYVAARAARAAFVFKRGRARNDYLLAMPDLVAYYEEIAKVGTTAFDVHRTAELELEWWIVHRQHETDAELENALADAAVALYRVPASSLEEYGRERTVAMAIRDSAQAAGGVSEHDWATIEQHLQTAWRSLSRQVRPQTRAAR